MKIVDRLIEVGADVNAKNKRGQTALFCASWWGHVKCMEFLLKAGADVNITDDNGVTPLIRASRYGRHKCVDVLLNAGADVNATDNNGCNALHPRHHHWLEFDEYNPYYVEGVKRLLRAGIHINQFTSIYSENAISSFLHRRSFYRDTIVLLYAAGERPKTLEGIEKDEIPKDLKFKLELKHICREAIRKHLLKLDLHWNLFSRVPRLGLPSALCKYLLFNASLDDDDNDDNDGN